MQHITRQGAMRVKFPGTAEFLGADKYAVPPVMTLRELESVAWELSNQKHEDLTSLRRWFAVLVAPGACLGGARPKANFAEADGSLWIGKFRARDDDRDIGAWEYIVYKLAKRAGVDVPEAKFVQLNHRFHALCVKRFDRVNGMRRLYASAMALVNKKASEGSNYLDLAQFLRAQGDSEHTATDLEQLFRRVVFDAAVENRDDHFRNHGFLLGKQGWRIAPAFDVTPNINKTDHALNIDDPDHRPSLGLAADTATLYGLNGVRAKEVIAEVAAALDGWRDEARRAQISRAEIEIMRSAFSAHSEYRSNARVVPARRHCRETTSAVY